MAGEEAEIALLTQALAPWLGGKQRSFWGGFWSGEKALASFLSSNGTSTEVTPTTALNLSAVWCAVLMIAGAVATMPLFFYRRTDGPHGRSRERFVDDPRYYMLHERPNPETTKPVFWETFVGHILLWGNGYAELVRDGSGKVREMWLIHPSGVRPTRTDDGRLVYTAPGKNGQQVTLAASQVLHVPHVTLDGLCGISAIAAGRASMSLTMQAENFGEQFYQGGSTQRYVARHPEQLTPEAHQRLTTSLNTAFQKNDPVVVLEEGIEITTISIPQKDAEYLSTRVFQVEEIARWFNIPLHKIKSMERATFSNIEHQAIEFVQDTLDPFLKKIESECSAKIVAALERNMQFVEFERDGRLQGDTAARTEALRVRLTSGVIAINEWRALEGQPPIDGGDVHLVPVNVTDLARLPEIIDAQIRPPEPPAPAEPEPDPEPEEEPAEARERSMVKIIATDLREMILPEIKALAAAPEVEEPDRAGQSRRAVYQRQVCADVVRRMLARERGKAKEHGDSPERLREWMGGPFYERYADLYRQNLLPVCGLSAESDEAAEEMARRLVEEHVAESRRHLEALLERSPDDLAGELETLLASWEINRGHIIPDAVMREELAHG